MFDQKSNQILNKTSAILDKLKTPADSVDKTNKQSKPSLKSEVEQSYEKQSRESSQKLETTKINQDQQSTEPKYRNTCIQSVLKYQTSKSRKQLPNERSHDDNFARLFICALWSPAGKGLTSWLSFVVSGCEFVTFPLVSWVRCGT